MLEKFEEKPNIVLLVMDTARAKNFSSYGYERDTDPNIREMSKEGVIFKNTYSNCIWTLPSHYSIFTGLLPSHHKVTTKDNFKTSKDVFTTVLEDEGYKTFGISSNAFVSPKYGFIDLFQDFDFIGDYFRIEDKLLFENDSLFEEIFEKEINDKWNSKKEKYSYFLKESLVRKSPKSVINGLHYLLKQNLSRSEKNKDDGADKANDVFMEKIGEEPFFGFINYVEPHDPYDPPKEEAEKFLDVDYEEAMEISEEADLTNMLGEEDEHKASVLQDLYDGEIRYLDRKIADLKKRVEEKSERETIFIITSDHGENFENGLWGHYGEINQNLVHVPLVVTGAGKDVVDQNFSLRKLYDLIIMLARDRKFEPETSEKVISEYWGLESHNWNLEIENYPEKYLKNQKSFFEKDLKLWRAGEEADKSVEKFIEMRCGSP